VAWYFAQSIEGVPRRVVVVGRWAIRKVGERILDGYYDFRGLDTKGPDFDHDFDETSDFVGYVPTPWQVLYQLFPAGRLRGEDVLLEYGSGKGRVVVWAASRFPVRRVLGVDHNDASTATARRNLETWRGPLRCRHIEFIRRDAAVFEVPDEVSVVYFYNPFLGQTFVQVLANICASLARRPRRLTIIYLVPFMHDALVDAGFTVLQSEEDLYYPWTIYVSEGAPSSPGP
jgi:16S rRNA G966 N2-methylase RsmD